MMWLLRSMWSAQPTWSRSSRSLRSSWTLGAIAIAIASSSAGCFTSWAITQASGNQRLLDEGVREVRVPMPGPRELLRVRMPLAPRYASSAGLSPSSASSSPAASSPSSPSSPGADLQAVGYTVAEPLPFAFDCSSVQSASDAVYRSGYRYGGRWKKVAAVMFALEAGLAATYYFASDREKPGNQLTIGVLGLDAIGTAALWFVPRKEIYRRDVEAAVTPFRSDCPAGLVLEIAGDTYPVDAAGRIGELGEAALDEYMQAPSTGLRLTYEGVVVDLPIGQSEICTWNRTRGHDQTTCPSTWTSMRSVTASLAVPLGTLTRVAAE